MVSFEIISKFRSCFIIYFISEEKDIPLQAIDLIVLNVHNLQRIRDPVLIKRYALYHFIYNLHL